METVLRNFGNSVGVVIPKALRESLHLCAGQTVTLEQTENGLLMKSRARKYTLEQLLAECDFNAPMPEDIADWQNMRSVGKEAW